MCGIAVINQSINQSINHYFYSGLSSCCHCWDHNECHSNTVGQHLPYNIWVGLLEQMCVKIRHFLSDVINTQHPFVKCRYYPLQKLLIQFIKATISQTPRITDQNEQCSVPVETVTGHKNV